MKESEIIYSVIYNLKKIIEEGEDKILELRKDAKKNEREKADLKVEVSKLTGEVSDVKAQLKNNKENLTKVTALYKTEVTKTVKTHILLRNMADDIKKKDKLVSDMVESCEAAKKKSDKCFTDIKTKVDMLEKEVINQKKNSKMAKQNQFEGNQVMNQCNFNRMKIDNTRLESLFPDGLDMSEDYKLYLQLKIENGEIGGFVTRSNCIGNCSAKLKTSCALKKNFSTLLDSM